MENDNDTLTTKNDDTRPDDKKLREELKKKNKEMLKKEIVNVKEQGNTFFRSNEIQKAIEKYLQCLKMNQKPDRAMEIRGDSHIDVRFHLINHIIYSNLASCYSRLGDDQKAFKCMKSALIFARDEEKILAKYLLISCRVEEGRIESIPVAEYATKLYPKNEKIGKPARYLKGRKSKICLEDLVRHVLSGNEIMALIIRQMYDPGVSHGRSMLFEDFIILCLETIFRLIRGCVEEDPISCCRIESLDDFGLSIHKSAYGIPLSNVVKYKGILNYFLKFKFKSPLDEHIEFSRRYKMKMCSHMDWDEMEEEEDIKDYSNPFDYLDPELYMYQMSFIVCTVLQRLVNELDFNVARKRLLKLGSQRRVRLNSGSALTEACVNIVGPPNSAVRAKFIREGGVVTSALDFEEDFCFRERARGVIYSVSKKEWREMKLAHVVGVQKYYLVSYIKQETEDYEQGHEKAFEILMILLQRDDFVSYIKNIKKYRKDKCSNCKKRKEKGTKLKRCSRCKITRYCGAKCQLEHWKKSHKARCIDRDEIEARGTPAWETVTQRLIGFLEENSWNQKNYKDLLNKFLGILEEERKKKREEFMRELRKNQKKKVEL